MTGGEIQQAYVKYQSIRGYKDVNTYLAKLTPDFLLPGNHFYFGHYPQSASGEDETPIEWQVLAREDNHVLLISHYALDYRPYHNTDMEITWEESTIRKWLNEVFIDKAFTEEEQQALLTTAVLNGKDQGGYLVFPDGGTETSDRVFLLSGAEIKQYMDQSSDLKCTMTAYAKELDIAGTNTNCAWWLRSPGFNLKQASYIGKAGNRSTSNTSNVSSKMAIRPAIWIDLNAYMSLVKDSEE